MKPRSLFLEHVYGNRMLAEAASGPSPQQIRRVCLLARCDDLIRGMSDHQLEALGRALSVYGDINLIFMRQSLLFSQRDKEAVRAAIEKIVARERHAGGSDGLEQATALARAELKVPSAPAAPPASISDDTWDAATSGLSMAKYFTGEKKVGSEEDAHAAVERGRAEAAARMRAAQGGGNVVSQREVEDYLLNLRRRAATDPTMDEEVPSHWRYLIAPSIMDAHGGKNFYGPGRHRYPFYHARGQIKRYMG